MHRVSVARLVRMVVSVVVATASSAGLVACGGSAPPGRGQTVELRLGYFPNLTHATAIVGVERGIFKDTLGPGVNLTTRTFNAGPEAVTALLSGAIDATYIGPNPAINAWAQTGGKGVKIVAGAASGGVFLVVRPEITKPEQLKGKTIATPQLGNTQDVALRYWLKQKGFTTTKDGGGDVSVKPQDNAVTVDTFSTGAIDGAWVPEPTAAKLVAAGGKVLVDERDLWPGGRFVITHLLVTQKFLTEHRDVVKKLIEGSVAANAWIVANPGGTQRAVSEGIGRLTGKPLDLKQIESAWPSLTFLDDPVADSLRVSAAHAQEVGLLQPVDLTGIYDLSILNDVLKARGSAEVTA